MQDAVCHAGLEGNRKFMPVERELVFDIDLTDYDDVRTCGKGAHICNKCWPLMAVAIKVLPHCLQSPASTISRAFRYDCHTFLTCTNLHWIFMLLQR